MTKEQKTLLLKWVAIVVVVAIIAFLPTSAVFTGAIKAFFAITVFGILMFAMGLFDSPMIPSLVLMFGYTFIDGIDLSIVMSGWSKDAPWIVICIFIIIAVANKTPLFKRIAYSVVKLTGGSYTGICVGFWLCGLVLSLMGDNGALVLMAIAFGVVEALGLKNTKAAAGIMICSFSGVAEAGLFVYSPTVTSFLYGIASSASDKVPATSNYGEWFVHGLAFIPLYVAVLIVTILLFRPKEGISVNGKEYFASELKKMGAPEKNEKKVAVILAVMIVYLLTSFLHGFGFIYGFVAAVILLFAPGIKAGSREDIKQVNFAFPIFIVACLAIGNVANVLGVGNLIAEYIAPYLSGGNIVIFLAGVAVLCFLLNFILTPMAVFSCLLIPLTMIYMNIPGVKDIYPLLAAFMVGVGNLLLPHETSNTLVLFSFDCFSLKDFMKGFGVKAIMAFIWFFVAVLYWKATGLF